MKAGQLEQAGALLDQLLEDDEQEVERIASHHYSRAQVYDLQFQPLKALPHYKKAYQYRPENVEYAHAYARILHKQNQFRRAAPIYEESLTTYRKQAEVNPAAYLPNVANTLNNLAILYSDTQRLGEAEKAYQEALTTYRKLAEANPAAYLPDVAETLKYLAILYRATQRPDEADQAYQEALKIRNELDRAK